jgi:hypothetical protein
MIIHIIVCGNFLHYDKTSEQSSILQLIHTINTNLRKENVMDTKYAQNYWVHHPLVL